MSKRGTAVSVYMTGDEKQVLKQTAKRRGMTQRICAGRILSWFVRQPDLLQAVITGQFEPESETQIIELLYKNVQAAKADLAEADVVASPTRPPKPASRHQGRKAASR